MFLLEISFLFHFLFYSLFHSKSCVKFLCEQFLLQRTFFSFFFFSRDFHATQNCWRNAIRFLFFLFLWSKLFLTKPFEATASEKIINFHFTTFLFFFCFFRNIKNRDFILAFSSIRQSIFEVFFVSFNFVQNWTKLITNRSGRRRRIALIWCTCTFPGTR